MERISISNGDGWAEAVGRSFYPLALSRAGDRFSAFISQTPLSGGLSIAKVICDQNELYRSARMVQAAPNDDVLLLVQLAGRSVATQRDRRVDIPSGTATLFDPLTEYRIVSGDGSHQLVLMLPRAIVRTLAAPIDSLRLQPLDGSLSLRALTGVLEATLTAGDAGAEESAAVSAVISDLTRSLLAGRSRGPARSSSREELAARAKALIEDRHADPRVTAAEVADAVGVTQRSLGTILREEGGPSQLLRSTRLRTARGMLGDPLSGDLTIGEIAARSGFADNTTFIRAFRREFGMLPSEMRGQ